MQDLGKRRYFALVVTGILNANTEEFYPITTINRDGFLKYLLR